MRNRFIVRPDVPANRAERVSSGRTISSGDLCEAIPCNVVRALPGRRFRGRLLSGIRAWGALMRASSP
jgi:putative heme iron utilization protein